MFSILISGLPDKEFSLLDYFEGDYVYYTNNQNSEKYINLGCFYMNYGEPCVDVIGESMTIYNFEPISAIKQLSAEIVKTECLQDGTVVIYAYTNKINKSVEVENEKINIQIAQYDNYSVIGWPLILGGF